jgi:hypothetical protein
MTITSGVEAAKFARIWRGRTKRENASAYERYWLSWVLYWWDRAARGKWHP